MTPIIRWLVMGIVGCVVAACADTVVEQEPDDEDETPEGPTYANPVLNRDFPDPTVIAAPDGAYYAYGTETMINAQRYNIQVAWSPDLVNWEWQGDALPEGLPWAQEVRQYWAPHILYAPEQDRYVMYFSAHHDELDGKCLAVATSASPLGPFQSEEEPLLCGDGFVEIDPMAFDDPVSGRKLLYWGSGGEPIKVQELADDRMRFKPNTEPTPVVFPGQDASYSNLIEGAWVIHRDGTYFLFYSGDNCCGEAANYAVMVARAEDPFGPFTRLGEVEQDDTYYLFGTGRGIAVYSFPDMETWEHRDPVFDTAPEWAEQVVPDFRNHIWAPDISYRNGQYYLYYSISAFGRNTSAIGVATNATLHPDDPEFQWVDHGPVVRSVPGRDLWNAIDPNLAFDDAGTPWMSFGSHWGGLKLVKMADNLIEIAQPEEWHTIAARHRYWKLDERDAGDSANPELDYETLYPEDILELNRASESGAVEAPFIIRKDGYYYLFASWDRCCRGVNSTYKVVVGRSESITGPYFDKEGEDMVHGGGSLVVRGFAESERWAAGGHNAAYTFDGTDYLVFHAYDTTDDGQSKLIVREIAWDDYGWPTVSLME